MEMTPIKLISIMFMGLAIGFTCQQYAIAEEPLNADEIIKIVSDNISYEYITCAAFYVFSSEGLRRSGDIKMAIRYDEARESAMMRALVAATEGRNQEMAQKVTMARFDLEMKDMMKEIDSDISC